MPGEGARFQVFMEEYSLGMCSSWLYQYTFSVITVNGYYCCMQQDLQRLVPGLYKKTWKVVSYEWEFNMLV